MALKLVVISALPARDELHELVEHLDEPTAERVLRLVKSELRQPPAERPWPTSLGAGSGPADLAANVDAYLDDGFGQ